MKNHTCCFTGHRDLSKLEFNLGDRIERAILKCLELGIYRFENGMALGFDLLAARRVLRLREFHPEIELHLMIPCRDQCKLWPSNMMLAYRDIMRQADRVEYLADTYYDGCMLTRNQRMINDSCACICFYDGRHRSGTGQTVRLAQKNGLLIFNCNDEPGQSGYLGI